MANPTTISDLSIFGVPHYCLSSRLGLFPTPDPSPCGRCYLEVSNSWSEVPSTVKSLSSEYTICYTEHTTSGKEKVGTRRHV